MNEYVFYWKSRLTGIVGHGNITKANCNIGLYRMMCTKSYSFPVSRQVREIYNQD